MRQGFIPCLYLGYVCGEQLRSVVIPKHLPCGVFHIHNPVMDISRSFKFVELGRVKATERRQCRHVFDLDGDLI